MTDPTPAEIEAGARALAISAHSSLTLTPTSRDRDIAQAVLRATLPAIEARVRAQVVQEIAADIGRSCQCPTATGPPCLAEMVAAHIRSHTTREDT